MSVDRKDVQGLISDVTVESFCSETKTSVELNPFTVNSILSPVRLSLLRDQMTNKNYFKLSPITRMH